MSPASAGAVAFVLRAKGVGERPARRREQSRIGKHHGKAPGNIRQQRDLDPCRGSLVRCPFAATVSA